MRREASVMLGLLMLLGCRPHHKKLPASVPPPQVHTQEKTIDVPAAPPRPVKVGPVPLAYIVESGGLVRVFDAESGAPLAQASAGPMEIVSVAESGVRVGKQLLVPGPLPAGRIYEIFVDSDDGKSSWRNDSIKPGKH
jgi:hypothetical protein